MRELYLGKNHALTTRCADRLDAVVDRTFQIDFNDNEPPFVPLQMTVFSSGIRPSAIVPYATAYPFTTSLQNFFSIIVNGEPLRSEAEKSPLWKGGREMSKMGFSKDNINTSIQSMKTVAKGVIMNQFKNAKGKSMKFKKGSSVGNRNLPISIAALTNFHHTNKQRSEDRSASWDYNDDIGCARKIVLPADKLFENIPLNKEGTKETQASGSNLTWSSANSLTVRYRVPVRPLPRITNTLSTSEVFTTDAAALYITQNPLTAKAIEYINSTCNSRVLTPSPPPISKLGNINPVSNIDVSTPSFQKVTATQDYIGGGRSINTIKSPRVPPIVRDMDASLPLSGLSSDNVYKRHFRDPRDVGSIILTSDREIPEPRPAINSGTAISVIALRDHELYNTLKDDVKRYLSAIPVDQNLTTDEDGNRKRRLSFTSRYIVKVYNLLSPHYIRPAKKEAGDILPCQSISYTSQIWSCKKMSVVLPDHTIEQERQWYAAIMVIRGFLDIILAKRLKANYNVKQN